MGGRNGVEIVVEERNDERFGVELGEFEWGLRENDENPKRARYFRPRRVWAFIYY